MIDLYQFRSDSSCGNFSYVGDKPEAKCRFHHCSVQAISRREKAQGCKGARPAGLRQRPTTGRFHSELCRAAGLS